MELGPRDRLSQAFMKELEKGRTMDSPYGPVVHLDLRHLGQKKIDAKIPFVRELCKKYQNVDPVTDLVPVRPVVHYMMGGVHTDIDGATPLPGLYAAGEVACVSINGANRLGSNSLPELLVFGARAGRVAAEYASRAHGDEPGHPRAGEGRAAAAREGDPATRLAAASASPPSATDMQKTVEEGAGIYRTGAALAKAVSRIREIQERFADITIEDHSRTFNTERLVRPGAVVHARRGGRHRHLRAAPGGVTRRAPADRFPGARRSAVPRALAGSSAA